MDMGGDLRASSVDSESIDSSAALGGKTSASNLGESDARRITRVHLHQKSNIEAQVGARSRTTRWYQSWEW